MFYLDLVEEARLERIQLIGNSLGGWLAAEILIRDRSRFSSLVQLAPAGIRIKGIPCGNNFHLGARGGGAQPLLRSDLRRAILALNPNEAQTDGMLRGEARMAAALVQS
jgi:pimeloyl-ACP methyl ester carboxylesterase